MQTDQNDTPETTTAPEAVTEPTTEQVETFDREYVEKLRKENASYRQKAKKAEEAAEAARLSAEREKLDEVERLKAEKADAEKRAAEIEARAVAAERKAALTKAKVVDEDAALKLLDPERHLTDDGSVNADALFADYPFLRATPTGPTPATSGSGTNPKPPNPNAAVNQLLTSGRQEDKARAAALLAQTMTQKG